MKIEQINMSDLVEVGGLQPEDWPDILPVMEYYIQSSYCDPFKVVIGNTIAGVGTVIKFYGTAWLAHLIVKPGSRRKGIGSAILNHCMELLYRERFSSVSLIATEYGLPLYKRAGFRETVRYVFYKRNGPLCISESSNHIRPCSTAHRSMVLELDRKVSGEDRGMLLERHMGDALVYESNGRVTGFFIHSLGEGLIVGEDPGSGIELLKVKCTIKDTAVLPEVNRDGAQFLIDNGFTAIKSVPRMVFGEDIHWQPERIYSRIGGNFG